MEVLKRWLGRALMTIGVILFIAAGLFYFVGHMTVETSLPPPGPEVPAPPRKDGFGRQMIVRGEFERHFGNGLTRFMDGDSAYGHTDEQNLFDMGVLAGLVLLGVGAFTLANKLGAPDSDPKSGTSRPA